MEVREAIQRARQFIADIFAEQSASALRLEEVEFDDRRNRWNITISFVRDNNEPGDQLADKFELRQRVYKTVSISDKSGKMISIKNRDVVV